MKTQNINFALQFQNRISTNQNQGWLKKWLGVNETGFKEDSEAGHEAIYIEVSNAQLNQHLITPSFLKHTIVIVSMIVGTFLVIILLVSLVVVSLKQYFS